MAIFVFIFPSEFGFFQRASWCTGAQWNRSFCAFLKVVVIWWVWICSRYADLRMIKQVVVLMMIVSLIRLILCVSAVAIISPHLLLPIYSQMLFFSATYTLTMLYATGLSYLFATFSSVYSRLNFFRKLKRPLLCYTHHMIAFLVGHLTISSSGIKGEVWKSFLLPKNVSCLL